MGPRKLIGFGTSSYVVSIPRSWVDKYSLKKGDFVYFNENGNGEITIAPQYKELKKEPRTIVMNIAKKTLKDINRELISNYIAGYDILKMQGQIPQKSQSEIRDIIRDFTTMDIIEQNKSLIIAKDFLNIEKISLEDLTRRIDLIIRSMLEDTKNYKNKSKLDKVYLMDTEVNRITFMTFRFIKKALNDVAIAKSFGLNPDDLLSLWLLVSRLEKVADEVKRVAKFFKVINLSKSEFDELMLIYSMVEKEYINVIKSYYTKDRELAFSIASNKGKIIEICNKFAEKTNKSFVGSVVEKLKGISVYISYIASAVYERTS